jgi:hypothetical protein
MFTTSASTPALSRKPDKSLLAKVMTTSSLHTEMPSN